MSKRLNLYISIANDNLLWKYSEIRKWKIFDFRLNYISNIDLRKTYTNDLEEIINSKVKISLNKCDYFVMIIDGKNSLDKYSILEFNNALKNNMAIIIINCCDNYKDCPEFILESLSLHINFNQDQFVKALTYWNKMALNFKNQNYIKSYIFS